MCLVSVSFVVFKFSLSIIFFRKSRSNFFFAYWSYLSGLDGRFFFCKVPALVPLVYLFCVLIGFGLCKKNDCYVFKPNLFIFICNYLVHVYFIGSSHLVSFFLYTYNLYTIQFRLTINIRLILMLIDMLL